MYYFSSFSEEQNDLPSDEHNTVISRLYSQVYIKILRRKEKSLRSLENVLKRRAAEVVTHLTIVRNPRKSN